MSSGAAGGGILERPLFGNEFLNVLYSYSLFHPFWTGAEPARFEVQKIQLISWIFPIMALMGFMVGRKKPFIAFFGLVGVLGIFFTKQVSIPFSDVYEWFFYNVPGFGAFREASKFYYLVALSYGVLIACVLDFLSQKKGRMSKYYVWIAIGFVVLALGLNVKPVVTREIGSLFVERPIPVDYTKFNQFINDQNEYYRIAWFPRPSWWRNATTMNPQIGVMDMLNGDWMKFRSLSAYEEYEGGKISQADVGLVFLSSPSAQKLLSSASVKYIVLPVNEEGKSDNVYSFYGKSSGDIYSSVAKIPYLKEISIGTSELKVFEIGEYKSHVYLTEKKDLLINNVKAVPVRETSISSSEYEINVESLSRPFYLVFSEKYASGWRVVPGAFNLFTVILGKQKDELVSRINDVGLNTFFINPQKICIEYSDACSVNVNGEYRLKLHLYYRPQLFYFVGIALSVITWMATIIWLILSLFIGRGKNENTQT